MKEKVTISLLLLAVLAAALAYPVIKSMMYKSTDIYGHRTFGIMRMLEYSLDNYRDENGFYPIGDSKTIIEAVKPFKAKTMEISQSGQALDQWGNPLRYGQWNALGTFDIRSVPPLQQSVLS